ncbi:MAG: tRNA lysidine(34) synthetase TilS, partial [Burkholderiales bacterium]
MLHQLHAMGVPLRALHVNHGLSPNAAKWQRFCGALCARLGIPLTTIRTRVLKKGKGLEAAAREARYAAFQKAKPGTLALAHHLDDQAETVLFNLLRGTGPGGASGMAADGKRGGLRILRPLLSVPRDAILAYAKAHRLRWVEDESNEDEALTRNFIRRRVGPLLESRFPRWRESLARAARHFAAKELDGKRLLRAFLAEKGLRAPSEARLL